MPSVTLADARRLAEECYPAGPEAIAELLGVAVEYCKLNGTDGWCIQRVGRVPKIRINSQAVSARRRFTLAHEVAHLLLGTTPEVRNQLILPFESVRQEEREADRLAAELLIPLMHLKQFVGALPVDSKSIKLVAKKSDVSDVVAAGRIVSEAKHIGLVNGAIAAFKGEEYQWSWSPTLRGVEAVARRLYGRARDALPQVYRTKADSTGRVTTATMVGSPDYPVMVLQYLPSAEAGKQTHHEVARELGDELFQGDLSFRQSFNGRLSSFKHKAESMKLDNAVAEFNRHYSTWEHNWLSRLKSPLGQAYLRHRLSAWTIDK